MGTRCRCDAAWQYFHATHSQHPFFLPSAPTYQISLMPLTRVKFISNNASSEVKKLLHACHILYCLAHILLLALFPIVMRKVSLNPFSHTTGSLNIYVFQREWSGSNVFISLHEERAKLLFSHQYITKPELNWQSGFKICLRCGHKMISIYL
jgi:hypothetical protein